MTPTIVKQDKSNNLVTVPIKLFIDREDIHRALNFINSKKTLIQLIIDCCDYLYVFNSHAPTVLKAIDEHPALKRRKEERLYDIVLKSAMRLRHLLEENIKELTLITVTHHNVHLLTAVEGVNKRETTVSGGRPHASTS